ncbi:glycosyltransferase involved in cell wall biosynthesis [Metabacillus niabensis]|uniref:Glycosyltransferase involved in cell wall biosynthesis n=1 Tax=Metabacillus niabensis TaxID=324854 RepID=A0ABT9YWB6_9BACI|nr:glycosyltransferase involved in cell wall biosynthesis [Metabacillus niabensis]
MIQLKLAFICTEKLPSPAIRGGAIQIMLDGIIPYFQNHQVTIFSITDPKLSNQETDGFIQYIRFPRENYEMDVANALKNQSFDLIHVFNRPNTVHLYKAASPTSKFVLSLHNDMFSELKMTKEESLRALKHVDAITTVSQYIKRTVTYRYPQYSHKIYVLYSGVDLTKFTSIHEKQGQVLQRTLRQRHKLSGKQVVLFIGRLNKTKGPHLLIKALEELIPKYPHICLVIVGGKWFSENTVDDYVHSLYTLAENHRDHIYFTNYIPSDEIPLYMTMADLFVCSSQWHEPLARVHYEAMAAGLPIITTDRGGNAEVIAHKHNGYVISDYDNPQAFSQAIDYLLSNRNKAKQFGLAGRKIVEEHFQFHHVAERLENIYVTSLNS